MKASEIKSIQDAERYCEGTLNDFYHGISDYAQTKVALKEYTFRLMEMFWLEAKKKIKENPKLLDE